MIERGEYINNNIDDSHLTNTVTEEPLLSNSNITLAYWLNDKKNKLSVENSEVFECDIQNLEDMSKYDPAMIPSSYSVAQIHERANEVGIPINYNEVCPCCFQPCRKERIGIFNEDDKLIRYGPGFSLYFIVIKNSLFMLLGIFFISSLYTWLVTLQRCRDQSNDCAKILGFPFLIHDFFPTKITDVQEIQAWLNFAVVFFLIIGSIISEKIVMKKYVEFTEKVPRISNYTILIQNLPPDLDIEQFRISLIDSLRKEGFYGDDIPIRQILPIYRVGDYYSMIRERHDLKVQIQILETRKGRGTQIDQQKLRKLKQKLIHIKEQIRSMQQKGGIDFSGKVFVIFQNSTIVQLVQEHHILSPINRLLLMMGKKIQEYSTMEYENRVLVFEKAPQPNDIIWENFGVHFKLKLGLRLMEFFLMLIFMGLAIVLFGGIYLLQIWLRDDQNDQSFSIKTMDLDLLLSLFLSFIITFFVYLGRESIKKIAAYSQPNTYSELYSSINRNLLFFNMFCIIIVPFIFAFFVLKHNEKKINNETNNNNNNNSNNNNNNNLNTLNNGIDSNNNNNNNKPNPIVENPLWLANIVVFVIFNCFSHLTHRVFKPFLKFTLKNCIKSFNLYKFIEQERLNKIFEKPEYSMAEFYANFNKIIMFSLVYSQIIPVMPLIGFIALLLTYLSDKYYILRKYSQPKYVSVQLFQTNCDNFKYILIIFIVINNLDFTDLLFTGKLKEQLPSQNGEEWTAAVILGYVFTLLFFIYKSGRELAVYISKNDNRHSYIHQDDFSQMEAEFPGDYERTYPFTKEKSNHEYIQSSRKASQSVIMNQLEELSKDYGSTPQLGQRQYSKELYQD